MPDEAGGRAERTDQQGHSELTSWDRADTFTLVPSSPWDPLPSPPTPTHPFCASRPRNKPQSAPRGVYFRPEEAFFTPQIPAGNRPARSRSKGADGRRVKLTRQEALAPSFSTWFKGQASAWRTHSLRGQPCPSASPAAATVKGQERTRQACPLPALYVAPHLPQISITSTPGGLSC